MPSAVIPEAARERGCPESIAPESVVTENFVAMDSGLAGLARAPE
jgi:hypothetical protein